MIVGVGELLWDVFPDGRKVAGGAPFNFAFHCHSLGHEAVVVSRVGNDDLGRELRAEVRRLGLSDEFIQTDPTHPTGTVQVTVDAQGQPSYEIVQNVAWDHIEWTPELERLATTAKAICFGTLAQRNEVSRATIDRLLDTGTQAIRIFDVNLRGPLLHGMDIHIDHDVKRCEWLKMSAEEARAIDDRWARDGICDTPTVLLPIGLDQRKLEIVTHGERGVSITDWQRSERERGVPANVVDTVGAGDSFTAALLCGYLEGRPRKQMVRFAMHYAAKVCEHQGATPKIDRDEVEIALLDDPWMRS
jgi:fructokinase